MLHPAPKINFSLEHNSSVSVDSLIWLILNKVTNFTVCRVKLSEIEWLKIYVLYLYLCILSHRLNVSFRGHNLTSAQTGITNETLLNSLLQIWFRSHTTEKLWATQSLSRPNSRHWSLEMETPQCRQHQQLHAPTLHHRGRLQLSWGLQLPERWDQLVHRSHPRKVIKTWGWFDFGNEPHPVYEETVSRWVILFFVYSLWQYL